MHFAACHSSMALINPENAAAENAWQQLMAMQAPRSALTYFRLTVRACAQIAAELDALERSVMAEGGLDASDYLKFMAMESGNVANDGMFSIQVLLLWLHSAPALAYSS